KEINNLGLQNNEFSNLELYLQKDYIYFEELEDERDKLLQNNNSNKLEFIKRDYSSNKSIQTCINILMIITGILFIGILIWSFIKNRLVFLTPNIIILSILIYGFSKGRSIKGILKDIESQKADLESLEQGNGIKIAENEKIMSKLLVKYNINHKLEFK